MVSPRVDDLLKRQVLSKKFRKGGPAPFAPFLDEELKAEREAIKTLIASKHEAIIRHIRIKRKREQLEKVRNRPSGVAKEVRKMVKNGFPAPPPQSGTF